MSCCGYGGSWFGNCGADGKSKLPYKWSEGVMACKTRPHPKRIIEHPPHDARHQNNDSHNHLDETISNAVITAPYMFKSTSTPMKGETSAVNVSSSMPINMPTNSSTHAFMNVSLSVNAPVGNINSKAITTIPLHYTYNDMSRSTPTDPSVITSTAQSLHKFVPAQACAPARNVPFHISMFVIAVFIR